MAEDKKIKNWIDTKAKPSPVERTGMAHGKSIIERLWSLAVGAGTTVFRADISGIWLGAKKWADGPFRVDMEGNVTAESITVTGGSVSITVADSDKVDGLHANQIDADKVDGKHVGTSGNTVPLLDGANTWSAAQILNCNLSGTGVKDEDNMASDSAVAVPTQQSVKAYVDIKAGAYLPLAGGTMDGNITMTGGRNVVLSSTTGTKIGTATNQLLGFYNAAPVDQPITVADADGSIESATARLNEIIDRLQELGLIA